MPWRFVVVADDLATIVRSNMVFDLSSPSAAEDTTWIEPGAVSWNWLSDHESGTDLGKLRRYIDLAADLSTDDSPQFINGVLGRIARDAPAIGSTTASATDDLADD